MILYGKGKYYTLMKLPYILLTAFTGILMNSSFGLYFRLRPNVAPARDSSMCECKLYLLICVSICKSQIFGHQYFRAASLEEANVRLIVIGQSSYHHIKPFCSLTGYTHEMYVDPQREIYKTLGMKRGEGNNISDNNIWWFCLVRSPHVKSNALLGSIRSIWRAMTGPAFDFQGDPAQQGGALIIGPGNEVHFLHLDKNRLDHVPINTILQLAGVKTVNFSNKPQIIDI
ncbi:peroxiredoxin-like 2C isoform X2 [Pipra filicauda]|uniref:Peroxiredoxin-like 2C isoform X2 n=1 Tax=Pipra filicauda TaxID=649802 RepID=A0A7R5KMI7_9PASS|nr:peroxiredoxin-like 2C isoform X2 [Pipra filicauda]